MREEKNVLSCDSVLIYCEQIAKAPPVSQTAREAKRSPGKKLYLNWTHIGDISDVARNLGS